MAPNVPHCRPLRLNCSPGDDVIAHKRAISRAAPDLYPWQGQKFTRHYGARFEEAVVKFQKRKGIKPASGAIGKGTHELLERTKAKNKPDEWAFDALAIKLETDFCKEFLKTPVDDLLAAGFYWYGKRGDIAYSQARPYQKGEPPWVPSRFDCSSFVTVCYFAADLPDPNGRGYDGLGYTGTLMERGERITRSQLKPGDLIFYGYNRYYRPGFPVGSPNHVALYVGDSMVLSMGSYPMKYVRLDYRSDINHFRTYNIS